MKRTYKTATRDLIAKAYGFRKSETVLNRLKEKLNAETDELLIKQLGRYTGHQPLLPNQVEAFVAILGAPQHPELLYKEE